MRHRTRMAGVAGGLMLLASVAGAATLSEDDPIRTKLSDVDARLTRIERVVANQSLLEISNQLEAMRADLRAMHNDVDELGHTLEAARKQQRDLYADLDARVKALEARGAPAPAALLPSAADQGGVTPGSVSTGGGPVADGDKADYQAAFGLLKDGQYDRAIVAFKKFLTAYPDSSLADNGHYWLGEAYYVNKTYPEAQGEFQSVVDKYPQSRKLPDALLKIGYCQYELKQWQAARTVLTSLTSKYADTSSAHLAQQRLDKMAAEGH